MAAASPIAPSSPARGTLERTTGLTRPAVKLIWVLALVLLCSGCMSFRPRLGYRLNPVIPEGATKSQVVARINQNITGSQQQGGLFAWQCMDVTFRMRSFPMGVKGTVVVEAPRRFRIRISNPFSGGDEFDVGANDEQFWLWQKGMEPAYLLTAYHDDLPLALTHFRIPFQPDWIMEVFGVIPVNEDEYDLVPVPGQPFIDLVANSQSPTGEPVRKVVRVDTRRGWVTSHQLWGQSGRLIASADLEGHRIDPNSGIALPSSIRIHWPDADLDLKLTLGTVEVNPHLPATTWVLPRKNGFRQLDMGAWVRSQQGPAAQPGSAAIPPAEAMGAFPVQPDNAANGPPPFPETSSNSTPGSTLPSPTAGSPPPSQSGGTPLPSRDASVPPIGRVHIGDLQ